LLQQDAKQETGRGCGGVGSGFAAACSERLPADSLLQQLAAGRRRRFAAADETGSGRKTESWGVCCSGGFAAAGDLLQRGGGWSKSAGGEKQKGFLECRKLAAAVCCCLLQQICCSSLQQAAATDRSCVEDLQTAADSSRKTGNRKWQADAGDCLQRAGEKQEIGCEKEVGGWQRVVEMGAVVLLQQEIACSGCSSV